MKPLTILLCLLALTGSTFISQVQAQDFSTPQKTFKTLVKAIKKKDLETYKKCWTEATLEREGIYSKLQNDPKQWEELQGIFKGPQKMEKGEYNAAKDRFKVSIKAPKANEGGIGTITLVKEGDEWKMKSW